MGCRKLRVSELKGTHLYSTSTFQSSESIAGGFRNLALMDAAYVQYIFCEVPPVLVHEEGGTKIALYISSVHTIYTHMPLPFLPCHALTKGAQVCKIDFAGHLVCSWFSQLTATAPAVTLYDTLPLSIGTHHSRVKPYSSLQTPSTLESAFGYPPVTKNISP